jgi:hypothetical protein
LRLRRAISDSFRRPEYIRMEVMKSVTATNYQKDKLYPAVARAVAEILATTNVVTPVELLLRLQRITKAQHEDWRRGRIPYLERVCVGNLSKLSVILRLLDCHARAIGLKPSQTVYHKWGRGGKHIYCVFPRAVHRLWRRRTPGTTWRRTGWREATAIKPVASILASIVVKDPKWSTGSGPAAFRVGLIRAAHVSQVIESG